MKQSQVYIVLIILMSMVAIGLSQEKRQQIKTYTSADGITEVAHSFIMKDSLGYIWTYGSNVVHRFDGTNFKKYHPEPRTIGQKENLNIHRMYCSPDNDIIICSNLGAYIYDKRVDQFISLSNNFSSHPKQFLPEFTSAAKVDDKLYFTSFVGLHSYDMIDETWIYHDLSPNITHEHNHHSKKVLWCIAVDKYNPSILIIFGRYSFAKFHTKSKSIVESNTFSLEDKHQVSIQNFIQTGQNNFFLSSFGRGTLKYNSRSNIAKVLYNESSVGFEEIPFRITHSSCLIGSEIASTSYNDFMVMVDTLTGEARTLDRLTPYVFDYTTFGEGTYWATTIKGLLKIQTSLETQYPIGLPNEEKLRKILFSNNGDKVLLSSKTEKLYTYDLITNTIRNFESEDKSLEIHHDKYENEFLLQTARSTIDIISAIDYTKKRTLTLQSDRSIFDIVIRPDVYIINQNNTISSYNKETGEVINFVEIPEKYYQYSGLERLIINHINDTLILLQNPKYTLSVNLHSGKYKEHKEIEYLGSSRSYSQDGQNFYMIIERSGIAKYKYNTQTREFESTSLAYDDADYSSLQSNLQNDSLIWIICRDHVRVFNMNSESYDMVNSIPLAPRNLTQYTAFTHNDAYLYSEKMLFKIPINRTPANIRSINIESINDGKRKILIDKYQEFRADHKALEIKWSAPYYDSNTNLRYYTHLEGRDDIWEYNENKTSKLYLGLSPGKYKFHVKAISSESQTVEKTLLEFEVLSPWYASWWFIALAVLAGMIVSYLIYRYRVHRLLEKTKLNKRLAQLELKALKAQLNPHFIFNSLNSIKRLIQINENKTAIEYLLLFSAMIRNVLDFSDRKAITLREELDFSTKYLKMEKMRFDKNFDFVVQVSNEDILDEYSTPSMILQPHLENAIWHGIMPLLDRKGKLYLDVIDDLHSIIIRIEDNGIGREASASLHKNNKRAIHRSKGQSLSIDRLRLSSLTREQDITTTIIDKDPNGPSPGTIIKINLKKSNT
ncbi:MAG: hypothetical protein ACJATI_002873 [Halioglobus sp.]|jgi:hypothetical protein